MCLQSYRLLYHRRALTTVFIHRHLLQCRLRLHPECCKQRKSTGKSSAIHSTLRVRTACLHHPVRDGNLTHHSVSLPLWHPTPVSLGAVGYYCVPKGEFVTLFNAFDPRASSDQHAERIPSLHGYGKVSTGVRPRHKRNLVQRLLDDIRACSSFRFRARAPSETKVARTDRRPVSGSPSSMRDARCATRSRAEDSDSQTGGLCLRLRLRLRPRWELRPAWSWSW